VIIFAPLFFVMVERIFGRRTTGEDS